MATAAEIERRIQENDTPRTSKRCATAKQIGELARQRAEIAEQLENIERNLGEVLIDAEDVIEVNELAQFTDVDSADLDRWLSMARSSRKAATKRRRQSAPASAKPSRAAQEPNRPGELPVDRPI